VRIYFLALHALTCIFTEERRLWWKSSKILASWTSVKLGNLKSSIPTQDLNKDSPNPSLRLPIFGARNGALTIAVPYTFPVIPPTASQRVTTAQAAIRMRLRLTRPVVDLNMTIVVESDTLEVATA
jgi:hypothetical protein